MHPVGQHSLRRGEVESWEGHGAQWLPCSTFGSVSGWGGLAVTLPSLDRCCSNPGEAHTLPSSLVCPYSG